MASFTLLPIIAIIVETIKKGTVCYDIEPFIG